MNVFWLSALQRSTAVWTIFFILLESNALAVSELRDLYRSPRVTAMGGASVAVVDDEDAVFINPAGLAQHSGFDFSPLHVMGEGSTDVYKAYQDFGAGVTGLSTAVISALMRKNIYARVATAPYLLVGGLGLRGLSDHQFAFYPLNQSLPQYTFALQSTNVFQISYGLDVLSFKEKKLRRTKDRKRRKSRDKPSELNLGVGFKMGARKGRYAVWGPIELFGLTNYKTALINAMGSYESGWGLDAGFQYWRNFNKFFSVAVGGAYTEIGGIAFGGASDPQPGNLAMGLGLKIDLGLTHFMLAYDYRNILQKVHWLQKNHIGLEISMPIVDFWLGLNQINFTYGGGLDLWLFRADVAYYSQEMGAGIRQDTDSRWIGQLLFKLDF